MTGFIDFFDKKLKPCPFCGGRAAWEYTPWNEDDGSGDDGTGWLECSGCGIQIDYSSRDEAIIAWNRRAKILETQT